MAFGTLGDVSTADVEEICKLRDDVYRNRWITFAYWKISERLRDLVGENASWCTFSTWSSRTIGENLRIEKAARRIDELVYDEQTSTSVRDHPWLLRLQYHVMTRDHGAAQLALALGNRLVFHEIGYAVIQLLDWVKDNRGAALKEWQRYRKANVHAYKHTELFPMPDEEDEAAYLADGLDCYFRAGQAEGRRRAQLVLRGNVLLGVYEQRRVDRMLKAALDPCPGHFVQVVKADPHGEVSVPPDGKPWALQNDWPLLPEIAKQFGGLMTRCVMALDVPLFAWAIRPIRLGHGIPRPDTRPSLYPPDLEERDDDPKLAALLDRYDQSDGTPEGCAARNWTEFDDRMNFIVNLFRAGQQDKNLYRPLPDADLKTLRLDLRDEHLEGLRQHGDDELDPWISANVHNLMKDVQLEENAQPRDYVRKLVEPNSLDKLLEIREFQRPLPAWADRAKLWHGQNFFRRFGLEVGAALFAASLPKSYTAERGAHVLTRTRELATKQKARRRIAETGQMLLDAMASEDSSKPPLESDSRAYKAARGVRLFHGAVRHMILHDSRANDRWKQKKLGKPINQEDLLGTLAAFTVVIIESLDEMGVTVTVEDRDAYFHLWLVMGDLLGIDYKLLFFEEPPGDEPPLTYADMQLLARVIFRRNAKESTGGQELMGALTDVSEQSMPDPLKDKGIPAALTRRLIGDEAADMLGVSPATLPRLFITVLRPFNAFISRYVRSNVFGTFASDLSSRMYNWWMEQGGDGEPPPWRIPQAWLDDAPTRARRRAGQVMDRMILVPRPLRSRMSGAIRPD